MCLPGWVSVAWGSSWAQKKYVKSWEWTPASLGISRTHRWKLQHMEVAASTVCSFSSENTATSPKHVGAPGSNGNSSSVGCSAEAFLVGLLWSNHLRTFGLGRWRFLHGRLNWAAGMYCTVSTRWFSASLIWPVFDSDEDMKVTCSSSIAYMSLHILGSTGRLCFWQQQPLQNATESLIPSALISLGIVCAAPTSSRSCH